MSHAFDALRIDHILGFFRIWEIPGKYREGIMGHFNPALPLSRDEIRSYGFPRDPAQFIIPRLSDSSLRALFEGHSDLIQPWFIRDQDQFLRLKPEFENSEHRMSWLNAAVTESEAAFIEASVQKLSFEVLFLEDPDQAGRFHPRVSLADTHLWRSLPSAEQEALKRLHDDFFYRRQNHFWESEALKKLPVIMEASSMLICGEDLGMIPDCVPGVLKRLGILSLELQRMPKTPGQHFGQPPSYPYLSVCTTSTHDMPTVRGWWEEEPESRQRFFSEVMQRPGQAPSDCTPDICGFVVDQHLSSTAMWCVLPLQDWFALDPQLRHPVPAEERINVPAIPRYYWRYRMHLPIEQLLQETEFNRRIVIMISQSGRNPSI